MSIFSSGIPIRKRKPVPIISPRRGIRRIFEKRERHGMIPKRWEVMGRVPRVADMEAVKG